jgi:hypothetical protein
VQNESRTNEAKFILLEMLRRLKMRNKRMRRKKNGETENIKQIIKVIEHGKIARDKVIRCV